MVREEESGEGGKEEGTVGQQQWRAGKGEGGVCLFLRHDIFKRLCIVERNNENDIVFVDNSLPRTIFTKQRAASDIKKINVNENSY